jgi:hypothetical protein
MFFIFVRIGSTCFLTKPRQVYRSCHILRSRYPIGSEDTRCLVSRFPCRSYCALTRGVRACWTSSSSSVSRIRKLVAVRFFPWISIKEFRRLRVYFLGLFFLVSDYECSVFCEAQEIDDVNYQYCFAGKYNICIDADEINSWLESARLVRIQEVMLKMIRSKKIFICIRSDRGFVKQARHCFNMSSWLILFCMSYRRSID